MITLEDVRTKSRLELIKILVNKVKNNEISQPQYSSLTGHLAQLLKVSLLENRIETSQHLEDLNEFCQKGILEGNSSALLMRALMLQHGLGIEENHSEAIKLYNQVMNTSSPLSMTALNERAIMYINGVGSEINYRKAIELFDKAIRKGDAEAMKWRAFMYYEGLGGEENDKKAINLFKKAISLGNRGALTHLGSIYFDDDSLIDFSTAAGLFEEGISHAEPEAMYNRATMFHYGDRGTRDDEEAIKLFDLAAKLGDLDAVELRAYMEMHGYGRSVNLSQAARFYRIAAENGKLSSQERLNKPNLQIFYYHYFMTTKQIEKAQELLIKDPNLINEFIEFDCKFLINQENYSSIKLFIDKCVHSELDKFSLVKLHISTLSALQLEENRQIQFRGAEESKEIINQITKLKTDILRDLSYGFLKIDDLTLVMDTVIHTWYWVGEDFLRDAVFYINKIMCALNIQETKQALLQNNSVLKDLLKNIAVILVHSMYGEEYYTRIGPEIEVSHILIFVSLINNGKIPTTVMAMNEILGINLIQKKPTKGELFSPGLFKTADVAMQWDPSEPPRKKLCGEESMSEDAIEGGLHLVEVEGRPGF